MWNVYLKMAKRKTFGSRIEMDGLVLSLSLSSYFQGAPKVFNWVVQWENQLAQLENRLAQWEKQLAQFGDYEHGILKFLGT